MHYAILFINIITAIAIIITIIIIIISACIMQLFFIIIITAIIIFYFALDLRVVLVEYMLAGDIYWPYLFAFILVTEWGGVDWHRPFC